ncbi:hypothetical protein B0T21DRAFT_279954 [Apiosordaria backusii]|uniref:Uncharacterized protein n=1 Tax=Apiosordaria backusii TaxID=314023 RepID=A0AA40ETA3_9PEZI|nr:hypothetical protein B0T21DRAFT_279954 [Apiosordaria backusii]
MQFKPLLALLPLVATALGYVVPEGTPDGFYAVTFDAEGNSTTYPIDPSTHAVIGEPFEKRGLTQNSAKFSRQAITANSWGATGRTFPVHSDYDQCTIGWRNFFDAGSVVPHRRIYYSLSGQAVLAGCNYKYSTQAGTGQFVDLYNGFMDGTVAGWWKTGWVHYYNGQFGDVDFTFWRDLQGTPFCTNLPQ